MLCSINMRPVFTGYRRLEGTVKGGFTVFGLEKRNLCRTIDYMEQSWMHFFFKLLTEWFKEM